MSYADPVSTTSPVKKKAVSLSMRAAWSGLCVTMMTVYRSISFQRSSSILNVEIGSNPDVGSSRRIISGSKASTRAMESLCNWPPERRDALSLSLSLPHPRE